MKIMTNPKPNMESRFRNKFTINDKWEETWPEHILAFINQELKARDKEWRVRIEKIKDVLINSPANALQALKFIINK